MDFDYCKILTIDAGLGKVKCEAKLEGFHYGASESSETDWGVDMRSEIFVLDRNVKVQASTDDARSPGLSEAWGARILVADFFEPSLVQRQGMLEMDNVQVYNCSQYMTYKAAITWFQATSLPSKVTNSVISSGRAPGIIIENSAGITLTDNVIADFVQQGVWIKTSSDITFDRNWVHHVQPETTAPAMFAYPIIQPFAVGGVTATEGTSRIRMRDNIVSGSWHHGFHFKPHECDENTNDSSDFDFRGNVAHSISGYGAIALNVNNQCTEVSDFKGYKCTEATIHLGSDSGLENRGRNIISADSHYGIAIMSGGGSNVHVKDSKVYGEHLDNKDCPENSPCDHCIDTLGIVSNMPCPNALPDHKTKWFKLPLFKLCTSHMDGQAKFEDIEFKNFASG